MLEPDDFIKGTQTLGFIGRPAFFNDARFVSPDGKDVPPGEIGEIWLRGPNVFAGYWNRTDANVETFTEGWFHTGDLALHDEENFTFVVGRSKEMFKSGGLNVYPAEIEAVIGKHPAVREVCVIGVADPKWNEVGRAIVALKSGTTATPGELIAFCEGQLARYKMPKSVVFVEALPRNTLGKVNRGELKQKYSA
jgi:fatty-acyl-CoA synthase